MMNYDYLEAMTEDVKDHIRENYDESEMILELSDRYNFAEKLNDDLWINDSVTGNASGSYTCNTWKAKEYVTDNFDLLRETLREFCVDSDNIVEHFFNEDWEYFDVSIRCYMLGQAIENALDELEEEFETKLQEEEEFEKAFDDFCSKHDCDTCPYKDCLTTFECKSNYREEYTK